MLYQSCLDDEFPIPYIAEMISGILLAAGLSQRFGRDKLQIQFCGETLVRCCLHQMRETELDEIIVVCHESNFELLKAEDSHPRVKIVVNGQAVSGLSSSIQCGLDSCNPGSEAVLIAHSDMPLVGSKLMGAMLEQWRHQPDSIVAPRYHGQQGNPVVISKIFWNEIRRLRGDVGCKSILRAHADQISWLDVDSDEILFDIDTESDYQEFLRRT
jgi:molybdenum cofactor cytidylyltransferase